MHKLSDKELLQYAIDNGIINTDAICQQIQLNERKRYLDQHEWKIWQGTDGKFYTYVLDPKSVRGRKLIKRKDRSSLEDELVHIYKQIDEEPYIGEVYHGWLDRKIKYGEIQKQTSERYETDFIRFIKNSSLSSVRMRYITEDMLEDFIRSTIHDNGLSSKAWANLRTLIIGIFKYAKKLGYTNISISTFLGDLDLSAKVFSKKHKSARENVFTQEEETLLISNIMHDEPSLLSYGIVFAFLTGLRAGEMSSLKWSDVQGHKIIVSKTEVRYKKPDGGYVYEVRNFPKTDAGFREIIITDRVLDLLEKIKELNPHGEFIFFKNGKRIRGSLFSSKLYRECDKLGILRRSLHKARKTYGSMLIDAKIPDSLVTAQMGHTDIATTKEYYYYNNKSDKIAKEMIDSAFQKQNLA